jgi:hypothetical protein
MLAFAPEISQQLWSFLHVPNNIFFQTPVRRLLKLPAASSSQDSHAADGNGRKYFRSTVDVLKAPPDS